MSAVAKASIKEEVNTPERFSTIEISDLKVTLGKKEVLKGLDLQIKGRTIGLLGPNGAGKTTLMNTLLGFIKPQAGSLKIFGKDISDKSIRRNIGFMPERDAFVSGMTGIRFVKMMGELSGLGPEQALERAHEAMFYVGLGDTRYRQIESYSLGMRQQVKLAQALVHGPRLLLLDEPTNGLDPKGRQRMIGLIRKIRDSGQANILLSSHLLRDVEACCDEVVILKDGRVAAHCDLNQTQNRDERIWELTVPIHGKEFAHHLRNKYSCDVSFSDSQRLRVTFEENIQVTALYEIAKDEQIAIKRLSMKRDSLEDIFHQVMEGSHGHI